MSAGFTGSSFLSLCVTSFTPTLIHFKFALFKKKQSGSYLEASIMPVTGPLEHKRPESVRKSEWF